MSKAIKWGVISTSNIGRAAVNPAIQRSRNGSLEAIASRDSDRARVFANEHGIPRSYGSYQELLADPDLDAVYIPLPNSLHHEWAIRAARAGKHVLCEKPLALNAPQCREMAAVASENQVLLMEAFMYRFHPQTAKVLELIDSGVIGALRLIRSSFTFRLTRPGNIRLDPELGGGSLMDVGCYCVNVSRTLAGQEPVEAHAFAEWGDSGVDVQMSGTLRFPGGVFAQFDSGLEIERRELYEVVGTEGSLSVPIAFLPGTDDAVIEERHGRNEVVLHTVSGVDEYQLMVEHFADCVLAGTPPRYDAAEAARNMQTIEALYESANDAGRVVRL